MNAGDRTVVGLHDEEGRKGSEIDLGGNGGRRFGLVREPVCMYIIKNIIKFSPSVSIRVSERRFVARTRPRRAGEQTAPKLSRLPPGRRAATHPSIDTPSSLALSLAALKTTRRKYPRKSRISIHENRQNTRVPCFTINEQGVLWHPGIQRAMTTSPTRTFHPFFRHQLLPRNAELVHVTRVIRRAG